MPAPIIPGPNNELITGSLPTQYGFTSNYVQSDTGSVTIASSVTTPASVISVSITTTGNPIHVECHGDMKNISINSTCRVGLYRDDTLIGKSIQVQSSNANQAFPYSLSCIDNVNSGTYTYSLKVTNITGGNFAFGSFDGPNLTVFEIR
jgi:hypothetical protein